MFSSSSLFILFVSAVLNFLLDFYTRLPPVFLSSSASLFLARLFPSNMADRAAQNGVSALAHGEKKMARVLLPVPVPFQVSGNGENRTSCTKK